MHRRSLFLEPSILIPYLASAAIALFLPEQYLQISWLERAMEFIANTVPSINGYFEKSNFPNVSRFYFSASSIIYLPWLIYFIKNPGIFIRSSLGFEGQFQKIKNKPAPMLFCFAALIFFAFALFIAWKQPGYQFGILPINEHRWALAAFGPLSSFFCVLYVLYDGIRTYLIYFFKLIN